MVPGKDSVQDPIEEFPRNISTDDIIKMYENVEFDMNEDNPISTEEILKMYNNDNINQESHTVKKSTRKQKQKNTPVQ